MEELNEMIGESHHVVENFSIEQGKIEEFARAIKDDNPVHRDEAEATAQGFETVPAPLTFSRTAYFPRFRPRDVDEIRPFDLGFDPEYSVHGEHEYEFERPIQAGDVLSGEITLTDVYQREGSRGGLMTFAVYEIEHYDQNGDLVLTERGTSIETSGAIEEADGDD